MNNLYKDYLNQGRSLSQTDRITSFLNHILKIFQENYYYLQEHPEQKERIVYSELTKYGLNVESDFTLDKDGQLVSKNIKEQGHFAFWIQNFYNTPNIWAYCDESSPQMSYWMQFRNGGLVASDEFEKIYLSIDSDHIYRGINELMSFISENDISHASKISSKQRTDEIVIRIRREDKDGLNKILNFIKNNSYIQAGLNCLNPFLPSENKVSHIPDNGESYNTFVAKKVSDFVEQKINSKRVDYNDFLTYSYNLPKENTQNILVNHLDNLKNDYQMKILNDAIVCTYKKCGYKQVERALKELIDNNNYNYFTRYDLNSKDSINYREQLINGLSGADALNLIYQSFRNNNYPIEQYTNDDAINIYVSNVIMNYQISILDKAVSVTCQNHDADWTNKAMYKYANEGITNGFSRYESGNPTNYRELLGKYVNKQDLHRLAALSLIGKGANIEELDYNEIISAYVDIVGMDGLKGYNR